MERWQWLLVLWEGVFRPSVRVRGVLCRALSAVCLLLDFSKHYSKALSSPKYPSIATSQTGFIGKSLPVATGRRRRLFDGRMDAANTHKIPPLRTLLLIMGNSKLFTLLQYCPMDNLVQHQLEDRGLLHRDGYSKMTNFKA